MGSDRFHVALIVPASNTVMEPDFHRRAEPTWVISTWRIVLDSVTRDAEARMMRDELPGALDRIKATLPHLVVFGCTSAGSLDGLNYGKDLTHHIETATGTKGVTVVGSMIRRLRELGPRTVAVFTPYRQELTDCLAGCVSEAGYEVVTARGMDIVDNRDIGKVTPEEIIEFVGSNMQGIAAECVFLSCTNWQAIDAIEPLQQQLGVPVISSNQVTLESVRWLARDAMAAATTSPSP